MNLPAAYILNQKCIASLKVNDAEFLIFWIHEWFFLAANRLSSIGVLVILDRADIATVDAHRTSRNIRCAVTDEKRGNF